MCVKWFFCLPHHKAEVYCVVYPDFVWTEWTGLFFNRLIFCFVFYKLIVLHFKSGNCESFYSDWSPLGQCDCNGWWLSIRKSTCVFIVFEKCPADTTICLIIWELIFLSLATEHRGNRTKRWSQVCKRFYCIEAPSKHTQLSEKKRKRKKRISDSGFPGVLKFNQIKLKSSAWI